MHKKKIQEAEQDFFAALNLDSRFVPAHYFLGQIAMHKNDLKMAEWHFNQAQKLLPEYLAAWIGLSELYLAIGDMEKFQEAYQEYKKVGGQLVPDYEKVLSSLK